MSFILDALKKSETDRQQAGSAEFAGVPTSSANQGVPRWLWMLGALLVINLIVLLGLLLRPEVNPVPAAAIKAEASVPTDVTAFAEQVAEAKQKVPASEEPRLQTSNPTPTPVSATQTNRTPSVVVASEPMRTVLLPTIHELRANGSLSLPDLHVDIHVYSEVPKDRFVFINMTKHNEGSRLAEGPIVEEITTDGVVLNQNGTLFLVPRD